jgi:2-oxoglutarate ferredoxin oxidoreductase subunit gamma
MEKRIIIAGFGGQGVLFCAKYLANVGMDNGFHVTWLPSYGPEMRGGAAYCSIVFSDTPIGSPLVTEPDILVTLNLPSFLKFESKVKPGGIMMYDSSIVSQEVSRSDITVKAIPATQLAEDKGFKGLASMIFAGSVLSALPGINKGVLEKAMANTVPERKTDMAESNIKAVMLGLETC